MFRRRFRPFGATVSVCCDDSAVLEACGAAVARFPTDLGVTADLTVVATTIAAGEPAWPVTSVRQWDGGLELRCGAGSMVVDHGAGTASLALPPELLACSDALRCFVEGAVSSLLIGGGWVHAVHSGLVVTPGGAGLLLRGPSGAGKSTLSYACLRAGFGLCSDDWVYGVAADPPDRLVGYPWRLFLVEESAARFAELAGVPVVPHPGADRVKVPVEPPVSRRRRSARVDAVVLLDPSPDLGLEPITPAEAADRFWGPALPSERADLPSAWVEALLDRPCYVLRRGTDPDDAAALLRSLR